MRGAPTDSVVDAAIAAAWRTRTGENNVERTHALVELLKKNGIPAQYTTMTAREMRTTVVELDRSRHQRAMKKLHKDEQIVFNEPAARAPADAYVLPVASFIR